MKIFENNEREKINAVNDVLRRNKRYTDIVQSINIIMNDVALRIIFVRRGVRKSESVHENILPPSKLIIGSIFIK